MRTAPRTRMTWTNGLSAPYMGSPAGTVHFPRRKWRCLPLVAQTRAAAWLAGMAASGAESGCFCSVGVRYTRQLRLISMRCRILANELSDSQQEQRRLADRRSAADAVLRTKTPAPNGASCAAASFPAKLESRAVDKIFNA